MSRARILGTAVVFLLTVAAPALPQIRPRLREPARPAPKLEPVAETRLLMAECRGPASAGYSLADAKACMEFMDLVLWNRVDNPQPFLAKANTLVAVLTAPGQFAGFQTYPNYSAAIVKRLQDILNIANSPKDKRAQAYTDFINAAIDIAARSTTIPDPSPGAVTAWRTAGSGSPGQGFTFFRTILGNSFYYVT